MSNVAKTKKGTKALNIDFKFNGHPANSMVVKRKAHIHCGRNGGNIFFPKIPFLPNQKILLTV